VAHAKWEIVKVARKKTRSACVKTAAFAAAMFAVLDSQVFAQATDVDVELVLAVDVSLSMSLEELEIQRRGYAAALTHQSVVDAIASGGHGRIAITYFEWAGDTSHRMVVPWQVIASRADAESVAMALMETQPIGQRRTSISGAIREAARLFDQSPHRGVKRVIDISGDGANNQGEMVTLARDDTIAQGITINGLPLMTNFGPASGFSIANLDEYYADCVIGGPSAFSLPVTEWSEFPEAVRRKLVLELAGGGLAPGVMLKAAAPAPATDTDCLIGEKMWLQRMRQWGDDR
jgi:hypothetical protein